ncbi:major facilitator superfamily domain-containing protein [Globomyces pollinis-pini]|nr:major facilitator superfamily domain-containing protein [Globomyces pollinis-pini]
MLIQKNRISTFICSTIVMLVTGSLSSFSLVSDGLRERYNWSFSDVNLISAAGTAALYISYMFVGPFYDKYGASLTLGLGMVAYTLGYGLMWLSFIGIISTSPLVTAFYYFMCGFGASAGYLVCVGVNSINFLGGHVGLIMGMLLFFYGIAGSFFAQIYHYFYTTELEVYIGDYFKFLAIIVLIVYSIGIVFVTDIQVYEEITDDSEDDDNLTPLQMFTNRNILIFALSVIFEQGLSYMNNVNAIIRAASSPSIDASWLATQTAYHVTLLSVFQSVGRLGFSSLSDVVSYFNMDRTCLLLLTEIIILIPNLILAFTTDLSTLVESPILTVCSILYGLGFGAGGGLFPIILRSISGLKYYGTACAFVMTGVPILIVTSNMIFGAVYDSALAQQNESGDYQDYCYGIHCFQITFVISLCFQIISTTLSAWLFYNSSKKRIY